jgi:HlyD family secretion protein
VKKRWVWIAIGLTVAALIGYSVLSRTLKPSVGSEVRAGVPVVVTRPRKGDIARTLSYAGTLQPKSMVTLTPKVSGRIEKILVKEGDWVRQGQVLAQIDDQVVRLQMDQASGALRAAQAQFDKAKKGVRSEELQNAEASLAQAEKDLVSAEGSFQRSERLYKEGAISKSKFEDGQRQFQNAQMQMENARRNVQMMQKGASSEDLDMAQSQVNAMEAQYSLARLQADNAQVASPMAGRVAKVHTDEGNMAGPTTPLVTVVQDDPILVKVPVPEKYYGEIRERAAGIEARVSPNALPGQAFPGRVSAVSPTVDPASRTFTVEIEMGNAGGKLHSGMYAGVDLVMERIPDALLVPTVALVKRGGRTGVFTVHQANSQDARFTEVRTGLSDDESTQILSGLSDSDRVVSEGNAFLEDGEKVVPAEAR